MRLPRRALVAALVPAVLALAPAAPPAGAAAGAGAGAAAGAGTEAGEAGAVGHPARGLPLGADRLPEQRHTRQVQPGVTLTTIVRGSQTGSERWTVEIAVPATGTSPDPDAPPRALSDRASARAAAAELRRQGFDARVEAVRTPPTSDYAPGLLGYRVRVGSFARQDRAEAVLERVVAAGGAGSAVYTGWDGDAGDRPDRGPWRVQVLTIDPRKLRGDLVASYGPDLERRETTSTLARAAGATAGVNAGFFVLDPAAGAPGDPAGVGVYDGRLLSEPVRGRPALLVREDAKGTRVERLDWRAEVHGGGSALPLDGVDRVPGLVRNCGGTADDEPTAAPLHDVTCTDRDELVAYTPEFGRRTPAGPGLEVVLDARDRVVALRSPRGGRLPLGGASVQATGDRRAALRALAQRGERLRLRWRLVDEHGYGVRTGRGHHVVNGGPELLRDGAVRTTPRRDGMVHPGDPSFYYGWAHKRNPRTFAGVDAAGRTVLVTADGRSTDSLGLSIPETATVARALGLVDALNLDGGGSTTMVLGGRVVNDPSDATGERPVGDALLVLPRR